MFRKSNLPTLVLTSGNLRATLTVQAISFYAVFTFSPAVGSEDEVHSGVQELRNPSQQMSPKGKIDRPTVSIETIGWTSQHEDSAFGQSPAGELAI